MMPKMIGDTHTTLSAHEVICAQRYREILHKLDGLSAQQEKQWGAIQQLQLRLSMGTGAIRAVLFIGSVIAGVLAFMKLMKGG